MTWGFTLENVSACWPRQKQNIFENINFSFAITNENKGLLPLMGPSGQGKSTLLYLLSALKKPQMGKITWQFPNGETCVLNELQSNTSWLQQEKFGFAFQDSTLSPHLTILENIAYPLFYQGVNWQAAKNKAKEVLKRVLLPSEKISMDFNKFPSELSGGQCQRVALAQAMSHNPIVIFADEPTGQLDRRTRKQVMSVLREWIEEQQGQRCLIWVTHHHVSDLDLMGINELLFLENGECIKRERHWLEEWV